MTDNNADETAENGKLSRRTAMALMGTSAVGGVAATSAFSKLTADRPIDVEVVSTGDSETADSGASELQITNNDDSAIDAEITMSGTASYLTLSGSSSASVSGTDPWTLTGLGSGETAKLLFERYDSDTSVDFDVEAFSGTDGFSIGTTQTVTVQGPPSSALHRWTFDDANTNSGTAADVWGSIDGTINGATTGVSGGNDNYNTGEAYEFDGTDDKVSLSSSPITSLPATVSVWYRTDDSSNEGGLLAFDWDFSNSAGVLIKQKSSGLICYSAGESISGGSISNDTWYHVVLTLDDNSTYDGELYVDGSLVASRGLTSPGTANSPANTIGSQADSIYHTGEIADVRVYNKALSSTEVSNLYNNGRI